MGRSIIKIVDKKTNTPYYAIWSSIVDAPVTNGMNLEEFHKYYQEKYGNAGMEQLADRLQRVEKNGTSSHIDDNVEQEIAFNRAGPGECCLTYDEIVRFYCLGEKVDEEHPCWERRKNFLTTIAETQGGLNNKDLDTAFEKFPYNVVS